MNFSEYKSPDLTDTSIVICKLRGVEIYEGNRNCAPGGGMCYNRANRKSWIQYIVFADFVRFSVLKVRADFSVNPDQEGA